MSEGALCILGFCTILLLLVAIMRKGFEVYDEFPFNWCPMECWPPQGQKEPCEDCPYLAAPRPAYLDEEDA